MPYIYFENTKQDSKAHKIASLDELEELAVSKNKERRKKFLRVIWKYHHCSGSTFLVVSVSAT
jgi:hypothetical protein